MQMQMLKQMLKQMLMLLHLEFDAPVLGLDWRIDYLTSSEVKATADKCSPHEMHTLIAMMRSFSRMLKLDFFVRKLHD